MTGEKADTAERERCGPGAEPAVRLLSERGQTVAVAESLTGGLLAAAFVRIPGVSAVFRGGVVAYATELKATLLGVPEDLLARYGPVHDGVAVAMAEGVRQRLGATYGLATTGVAGPGPSGGQPAGTVYVAVAGPAGAQPLRFAFTGTRLAIRRQTVVMSLKQLQSMLEVADVGYTR